MCDTQIHLLGHSLVDLFEQHLEPVVKILVDPIPGGPGNGKGVEREIVAVNGQVFNQMAADQLKPFLLVILFFRIFSKL